MIEDKNVLAIQCSNTQKEQYALFCDDKGVYHGNDEECFVLLAVLDNISHSDQPIKIYYHFPYICVSERVGLHAAVVNIADGRVQKFAREDYHSDVSSYSVGFLERNGRVLLIHQTMWNRLDITDLETGELLTPREVWMRDSGRKSEEGWPRFEYKNYLDYFHSLIHVSPDGKHFLSNGWVWQPYDNIMCFETERFFKEYELCGESIKYYRGYNWDRPCTFVGNAMFVIVADKDEIIVEDGVREAELKEPPAYHQLLFYKLSEVKAQTYAYKGYENYGTLPLAYSGKGDCDVFAFNEYGEVSGELYYEPETEHLIVLSEKGAFELTLDGRIVYSDLSIKLTVSNKMIRRGNFRQVKHSDWMKNWQYDTLRQWFYRCSNGGIEKRCIR